MNTAARHTMRSHPVNPPGIEAHRIEFTGSGGEYFRVWIVNVLLSIVTLGLYTPWARRRTAQYFYGHTQVAGSPLEFVAEVRRMVFGFLIIGAFWLAYKVAADTGQHLAASLLMFGFAVLAPFLWASAMRFRLGATRWRGIRLAFTARWKEVYVASWPVFAIAFIWIALIFLGAALSPELPAGVAGSPADAMGPPRLRLGGSTLVLAGLALILTLLCVIRLEYNYRRLLVARTRIGGQVGRWKPVYLDFVKVWLATALFFVLCIVGALGLLLVVTGGSTALLSMILGERGNIGGFILLMIVLMLGLLLVFVLASLPARAYREARMFQLVWNNVGFSHIARSKTSLRTGAFVWLRLKNLLLTLLTLGFYRPFAVASEYAAKVGSVTLYIKGGTDQLVGELVKQQGALGDAAADMLGLDLIG
ncbi:MAG: YjgN family protein [Pseudomonadota bacterium]|nr:YjgN family protein [Pseudomonadota bacterium]